MKQAYYFRKNSENTCYQWYDLCFQAKIKIVEDCILDSSSA
jgi:hypothetical protein